MPDNIKITDYKQLRRMMEQDPIGYADLVATRVMDWKHAIVNDKIVGWTPSAAYQNWAETELGCDPSPRRQSDLAHVDSFAPSISARSDYEVLAWCRHKWGRQRLRLGYSFINDIHVHRTLIGYWIGDWSATALLAASASGISAGGRRNE